MYSLRPPTRTDIENFVRAQSVLTPSYAPVGATSNGFEGLPAAVRAGWVVDHNRVLLGRGEEVFERAQGAVRRWEMFSIDWVELCWPTVPIATGETVAILVCRLGVWCLNAARIVYVLDEERDGVEHYGFAYGTLPDHAESGEERFCVQWDRRSDEVWYDLLAFSRPQQWPARIVKPYARALQRRFATASLNGMVRAVGGDGGVRAVP